VPGLLMAAIVDDVQCSSVALAARVGGKGCCMALHEGHCGVS
jgi:hypothetical protein